MYIHIYIYIYIYICTHTCTYTHTHNTIYARYLCISLYRANDDVLFGSLTTGPSLDVPHGNVLRWRSWLRALLVRAVTDRHMHMQRNMCVYTYIYTYIM